MSGPNHDNAASYRNSAVGLRSNTWGSIAIGGWDTPFNLMAVAVANANGRTANATTGMQANLLGTTFYGQGAWSAQNESGACAADVGVNANSCLNAGMNFDRRQKASLMWWSPNWNGFEAKVHYAAVQFGDGITASSRLAGALKPDIWDLSLVYTNGPLSVGYAYERQNDLLAYTAATAASAGGIGTIGSGVGTGSWQLTGAGAGAARSSRGTGHRVGAKYAFAMGGGNSLGLSGLWETLKWDVNYAATVAGDLTEMKKTAWRLQGNFTTGNHFFGLEYARANAVTGNITSTAAAPRAFDGSGTGSRGWMATYNYMLSKRTSASLYYFQVNNDTNANYTGPVFAGIATAAGADPKYYGVTLRHAF